MKYAFLDHPGPIPFAHRGGAGLPANVGIENTIRAFANAVDLGYRYLETDVHATSDGVPIVFHDHTLDRITDHHGVVAALSLAESEQVLVGGTEPIPTLVEALETFPDARFNIDVKTELVIPPLVDIVNRMNARDRVCISSFSGRRLLLVRRMFGPGVATSLSPREVATRLVPSPIPLAQRLTTAGPCVQVPVGYGRVRIVTPDFLARTHAAGKQVHVWTIDDPDQMHQLLDMGVDGIITDRPDVLRRVLTERDQWVEQ